MFTLTTLFVLLALACFLAAAFQVKSSVNLQALGLAFCVLAFLVPTLIR